MSFSSLHATLLASVAICPLLAAPVLAQDAYDLGQIVVSGGLSPIVAEQYGRAATVLTQADIEARDVKYAADLLRALPGVSVSRIGAFGGQTQIRMRGGEANHTLILIDGIQVASPDQAEYDFGSLLAADIERIEVLRGPQSAIYGSQAIGGVISITTRRASEPGLRGTTGIELGSDGSAQANLGLFAMGERGELAFSASRRSTGGFDISGTPGGEKDSDLNNSFSLNGRYALTETTSIGGSLRYTARDTDLDPSIFGAPTPEGLVTDSAFAKAEKQELFGAVFVEAEAMDGRMQNRLEFSFGTIDSQGKDGAGIKDADSSGTRQKLAYTGKIALDAASLDAANQTLTIGAETERVTYKENDPAIVFGTGQLVKRSRDQSAVVLEYRGTFGRGLDVQASARKDFNSDFKDYTTYALAGSYRLPNEKTRIHASYGTGVQNPTLIDQFGFFSDFVGNPNLTPELSKGFDFGVEQEFLEGRGTVDVTYFRDRLTNEITATYDPVTGTSTPTNQPGKSKRQGVEIAARLAATDALDLGLSYTWLDATNADGSQEVRRPKNDIMVNASYRLPNGQTTLNLDVQHVAGLTDLDFTAASMGANQIKLDDYTLVNVGFSHTVNDKVILTGGVRNLLDESYEEIYGFSTQGRTAFLGLKSTF